MEKSGVRDTRTFGFHLKRIIDLLEKPDEGRYKMTLLGETAYQFLKFMEIPDKEKALEIQMEKEGKTQSIPVLEGVSSIANIKNLLVNKDRLDIYGRFSLRTAKM